MLISLHKQATTTPKIRAAIQANDEPAWLVELDAFDGDNPRAALRHVGLTLINHFSSMLPCMMLVWSNREVKPHEVMGEQPKLMLERLITFFDRLMREGKLRFAHPEIATRAFVGAMSHYVFFEKMVGMHQLSAESYTDGLVDLFLRGLAPANVETSSKKAAQG